MNVELHGHKVHPDIFPYNHGYAVDRFSERCRDCGCSLSFGLTDDGYQMVGIVYPEERRYERGAFPCVPTPDTYEVPFVCRSGRIALANDLRRYLPEDDDRENLESRASHKRYIEQHADIGILIGFVSNAGVWFVPSDGGVSVVSSMFLPPYHQYTDSYDEFAIHQFSAELWWFCIVDAADLPEDAEDTYDRPIGYMDLPPGEYTMICTPGKTPLAVLKRRE
jgi:hypothetical protein